MDEDIRAVLSRLRTNVAGVCKEYYRSPEETLATTGITIDETYWHSAGES